MLNVYGAVFVYLLILAITIFNYVRHAEKLIIYHKYSIFVDVLSWIGGIILIGMVVIYYGIRPEYDYLLWLQFITGSTLLNIHTVRFVIHLRTKEKYHHSRKNRKY